MSPSILPHGGRLVDRLAVEAEADELSQRARELPRFHLTDRQRSDVELIATGALSPLEGFMGQADYLRVIREMRLASGLPWTLPITLAIGEEDIRRIREGGRLALADADGPLAVLLVQEIYEADRAIEAQEVYGTRETAHPGVRALTAQGRFLIGGPVTLFRRPVRQFGRYRLDPAESRRAFADRGWRTVVGFQTRNPVHRAHEYIQKCALEIVDGLFLHPLVGETKEDDIPAAVRLRCYEVLLQNYYPRDRAILGVFPAAMRYAGPREAVFHAIARKNYGCSHFIVGRDHAGVGRFYGPFDAHAIFQAFAPGELGITPLFFDAAFYCKACGGTATPKTCPHNGEARVELSGTQVRERLRSGEGLPPEFSRPEVAAVLQEWASRSQNPDRTRLTSAQCA